MTNLNDIFTHDSLKASDLQGRDCRVTIAGYEIVDFDDGKKIILSFLKTDKTLVTNKTNANTIGDMYGAELDYWIGKQITLFPTQVDFGGKSVACIRVRIGQPQPAPAPTSPLMQPPSASEPPQQPEYIQGDTQGDDGSQIPF